MRGRCRRGFTLLEVMVTTAILLIAVIGLLYSYINCIIANESSANLVIAAGDAQCVLEQIKGMAYADIDDFISSFDPSQFTNLSDEEVTFSEVDIGTNIANITVNVNWTERQRSRNFELSTRFAP